MTHKDEQEFHDWWEKHGQFCRAGGGDYEKTFAYHAWERQADRYNFVADRHAGIEQRLFVWAHEKLDEERKTEYFNIIANGMESVHDNNTMRLLNQEKHRALIAERERDALQAKLDAVMLEYCPEDMTPEQMAEWARHQKPCDSELEREITGQRRLNSMGAEREAALLGKVERLTKENAALEAELNDTVERWSRTSKNEADSMAEYQRQRDELLSALLHIQGSAMDISVERRTIAKAAQEAIAFAIAANPGDSP